MKAFFNFILFIRWPAVIGLLIASIALQVNPNLKNAGFAGSNVEDDMDFSGLAPTEQWSGVASYSQAVTRAAESVVNIYTRKESKINSHPFYSDPLFRRFFREGDAAGAPKYDLGSGVIVTQDGYLLTNNHVINDADEIVVSLQDGRDAKARVVGVNQNNDLAVLKIELENLKPIAISSEESYQVGDVVLAIGNPFGVGQTVTQGIISATRRRGLNIARFENFIQTDAAINPGNSGGALINTQGALVGIATANLAQSGYTGGIGFAIPSDTAMQTVTDIIEHGRVIRGWLGIDVDGLAIRPTDGTSQQRLAAFVITRINPQSPAKSAGLKVGDIIMRINDNRGNDLSRGEQEIAESRPGDKVEIEFVRDQKTQVVQVELGVSPFL